MPSVFSVACLLNSNLLLFARLNRKTIGKGQHGICRLGIIAYLRATLSIDRTDNGRQLAQDIETDGLDGSCLILAEGLADG